MFVHPFSTRVYPTYLLVYEGAARALSHLSEFVLHGLGEAMSN